MNKKLFKNPALRRSAVIAAGFAMLMLPAQGYSATSVKTQHSTQASTELSGVTFTGFAGIGLLTGEAHEYVYWPSQGGHTASELIWEIDSLTMLGFGGSLKALDWLNVNAEIWVNIGDGDGHMEDYDWMVPGMEWTDRSIHEDTDVTTGFIFDVNAEMTAFKSGPISFNGIAGFRRDVFEWQAKGGTYLYSYETFRDTSGTFPAGELGITYEQTFNVPYVGVGIVGDFNRFKITANFIFSSLVYGEALDHHHMRNLETTDEFSGENMWKFDVAASFDITKNIGLKAAYFYESYDTMTGDSDWDFYGEGYSFTSEDGAGADLETSMFSLDLVYSF